MMYREIRIGIGVGGGVGKRVGAGVGVEMHDSSRLFDSRVSR